MDILFITYLFKVSSSLLLFHIVYYVFLRKLTFHKLNRYLLLVSVFLSVLLPLSPKLFSVPLPIYERILPIVEITTASTSSGLQTAAFSVYSSLVLLWILVGMVFLSRALLTIASVIKLKRHSEVGIWKSLSIRYHQEVTSPFSFLNQIYLPESMKEFSEERHFILEHESIHIQEGHSFDKIFLEILSCMLWFHPSVYWLKAELDSQHEFYVDRKITEEASYEKKVIYGQLLLNAASSINQPILINTFYNSLIKNRILMMTQSKHHLSFLKNYLTLFIASVLLLFLWSCNTESASNQDTQELNPSFNEMEVLDLVETMPEFIGGDDALLKFTYQSIEYPAVSRENNIQGLAVVGFIIEPDGSISNIEMLRELDDATSEEVLRVVKTMPNWKPGKNGGQNVRVSYKMPVRFKLE